MSFSVGEKVYPLKGVNEYAITTYGNGYGIVVNHDNDESMGIIWVKNNGEIDMDDKCANIYYVATKYFKNRLRYGITDYDIYIERLHPDCIPGINDWFALIKLKDTGEYLALNKEKNCFMIKDDIKKPITGDHKKEMYRLFCEIYGTDKIEHGDMRRCI